MTTTLTPAVLLFGVALVAAAPAGATGAGAALRDACRADYKALCPDVQPGGGRILACFKAHQEAVSPGCRAALEQARAAHEQPPAN